MFFDKPGKDKKQAWCLWITLHLEMNAEKNIIASYEKIKGDGIMHNRHIKVNDLIIGIISMILGIYCGGCTPSGDSTNTPKYKTFITAAKFNGDIQSAGGQATAIESADSLCMADANKPTDSSTYKAMLVDGTNRLACTTSLCSGG